MTIGNSQLASSTRAMKLTFKSLSKSCLITATIWVCLVLDLMSKWDSGVEFDVILNNLWWKSLEVSIIPCKNAFIPLEQCFDICGNWSSQCYIQFNCLKIFDSLQIV